MMSLFIQAHWLALLFGEYVMLVVIVFNAAISGTYLETEPLSLKHLEYFFVFFFGLPLFVIEYIKQLFFRSSNNG